MLGGYVKGTLITDVVLVSHGGVGRVDPQSGRLVTAATIWVQAASSSSFYAEDLVLFILPNVRDLQMTRIILSIFENSSGLGCNMAKCQMAPIRCN
jgi:hypothetical protein